MRGIEGYEDDISTPAEQTGGDDIVPIMVDLKEILECCRTIMEAIIVSVLRSKTKINSFAYCEGAIEEFQENLPLGYLSYLREMWRERKGGRSEHND